MPQSNSDQINLMRSILIDHLTPSHSDDLLSRFLTKHNMDVNLAVKNFLSMLEWRKQNGVDTIEETFPRHFLKYLSDYWPGMYLDTADGKYTIYYENFGLVDVKNLMKVIPISIIINYHIYTVEQSEKKKLQQIQEIGKPKPLYVVQDLGQLSLKHLNISGLKLLKKINVIDEDYYPNRFTKMIFTKVPMLVGLNAILNSFTNLLENKILVGEEWLNENISKDDLPTFLGGNMQVEMRGGGAIDYDDIFPCKRELIQAGLFLERIFEIKEQSTINVYFATVSNDIKFSLYLIEEDDQVHILFEQAAYDSHINAIFKTCVCKKIGRCIARFDNGHSRWTSKNLIYNIEILSVQSQGKV